MSARIVVRSRQFDTRAEAIAVQAQSDVFATAFYAGLSTTFPDGERFFILSVKRFAHLAQGTLAEDVAAFIRQESHHTREHMQFNAQLARAGFDAATMEARAQRQLAIVGRRGPHQQLAASLALEHFTAIFAQRLLADPRHLAFCDSETRALWRWHAVEEIEHKSVAFDVFMRAAADWSPLRRYWTRAFAMLDAMVRLSAVVLGNVGDIHARQCGPGKPWLFGLLGFVFVKPGVITQMAPAILDFFRPGFHPAQTDDEALLQSARRDLEPAQA